MTSLQRPRPNEPLRLVLLEAGWSGQSLADAVNTAGAEAGLPLHYGRASVTHWVSGMRPRPPVPELIAEALSRRLRRRVSTGEIGFAGDDTPADGEDDGAQEREPDAMKRLIELNAGPRQLVRDCAYTIAGLSVPDWIIAVAGTAPGPRGPGSVTPAQVETAQAMTRVFSDADSTFGGGQAQQALAGYLAENIAPLLHARMPAATRRKLFGVATELTYLQAFMCFDEERHGTAQRYYRIALRLAAENRDAEAYAVTLRAMSVQAHILGHHHEATDLADAALSAVPATAAPVTHAFLRGQAAVAAAGAGDERTALVQFNIAERLIERASSTTTTAVGVYHQSSLAYQQAVMLDSLGDKAGARKALTASLRDRPAAERRARAITLARLAELQLGQGHLEEAVATWNSFLDDLPQLRSGRARTAFKTMRSRLRAHQRSRVAKVILQRATAIRPAE
jgi:tetratricopeptide (TPR) repeat protein